MWTSSTMLAVHLLILLQVVLSLLLQTAGLISDYKTCGDQACARLMCRVRALRDHHARDCRFLSFKKGDMIDVYHKLSGRRSELWAGSKDKDFGYFPRDAVKLDEVFVDEKKEMEMRTQETDFLCMDAFGTLIPTDEELEDYEFGDQTAKPEDLGNSDFDDRVSKSSETKENMEVRLDNVNKDRGKAEQSQASWIGSAVSGWFSNDAGNIEHKEENFRSRKLALDLEQLDEKQRQMKLDWTKGGLTSALGLKNEKQNEEDLPSVQVSDLLGNGIKSVSCFVAGEDMPSAETKTEGQDENIQSQREKQEAASPKAEASAMTIDKDEKKDAGWYNNVFNTITNFYRDPSDKSEAGKNEGEARSSDRDTDVETVMIFKDEKNPEAGPDPALIQYSEDETKSMNHEKKQQVSTRDESRENEQLGKGWYGSIYNRMTGFYGETPDKSNGVQNGVEDPPGTPKSEVLDPSPEDKLKNSEESMTEDSNAEWYSSIYSRISNVYGDPSDTRDVPDVMKDSQTQSGTTRETSSSSTLTMNDNLRKASHDGTKPSKSVQSELSEASDPSDKETIENLTGSDQSEDTSRSIFSIKHFSMMINGLKSPFKPNNAEDKEEKTLDTGKEKQSDKDDELSVRLTEVKVKEEEDKEEEDAVSEVEVAEPVEGSLDCNKKDTGLDDKNNNKVHVERVKVSDFTSLMTNESETLTEKLDWSRVSEHISDTSQALEGDMNTSVPEKHPAEEEPQSECETRPESGLQLRTDVTEMNSDKSDKAQAEGEAAHILAQTEKTAMEVMSSKAEQINHTESNAGEHGGNVTQVDSMEEKKSDYARQNEHHNKNITLMEDDEERAGGDVTERELHGCTEGVDVIQVESAGEIKDIDAARMETCGEKSSQMEAGGEVTGVRNTGGQDGVINPQNETERQKENVDVILRKYEGEKGGDITQVKSDGEKEGFSFTQKEPDGEKEGEDTIQKKELILHNAQTQNSHSKSVTEPNKKIDPDESIESEKTKHSSLTDGSETFDQAQTYYYSKKHGDKTTDVKHHKAQLSARMQKPTYPNLQAHLSEKDIQVLLRFFSGQTLTWLDFIIGRAEYINGQELAKLHEYEQKLEHLLKTRNQEINPSLQTIHTVLAMLPKKFRPTIADGSVVKSSDPSQTECVSKTCVSTSENTPITEHDTGKDNNMKNDIADSFTSTYVVDSFISNSIYDDQEVVTDQSRTLDALESDRKTVPHQDTKMITEEFLKPEESKNEEALRLYTALVAEFVSGVFMYTVKKSSHVTHAIRQVVMSLPDDIRPGPDLYGVPWEAVIFTATLGLLTFLLFTCRFFHAVKSRLYCSKERRMGQKVAELLDEKCKVLEKLSECEHKFKKLEAALQNGGPSAQASERDDLEVLSKQLEEANVQMQSDMEKMQEELETQDQLRKQQEEQLTKLEKMLKKLEQEAMERKSQLEQDKTTLKIHQMNTERLQRKLQEAKEENSMLLESKAQLEQEAEGWKERLSELEEEKRMCETSHNGMMENCLNKDERIKSLTERLLKMRDWDSEEESTVNDTSESESKNSPDFRQKQKVQKLINAAKMSADLKAMEEDKDRLFAKLADEIKAKEDLQGGLDELQCEKESLLSESSMYSGEIEKLQHKLQIMSEMYQEKELKLHRMLTVEEKERSQKEEQLNKAGKKISLATDELNSYRQRATDLEEELEKTNQAYKNQISAHEKKAHDNWLAARAADRDLTDVKRENSVLRQRLTDWQFKLELMEKNPQARAPLFRGERSPFGPSPLGRPPSETRPFLSPPTLMDGPPRVSPQFPMMPGGRAPPGGVDSDRSVSYSEGGSPTWERERERRSLGPPGPDPGLMYRRPLSAPFLRAPPPPEASFSDKSESSIGGEGPGFNGNGIRDNGRPIPGPDLRAGPLPPPPFLPMDPRDPHFPRRVYRPDFFPPHPLSMRGPPLPPGVFPRIPLPAQMAFPPMRPPSDHVSSEPPSRPSPTGSEQPPEQPPSAHDII